jgi:glucose-1-phosphate cytidylyltransferase
VRAVILCGGKGTRAHPHTEVVPKPLLHVAGEPVLGHVLAILATQGVTEFVLSAGHLADQVVAFARTLPAAWDVEVVDTGAEAGTAERITGVAHLLDGTFLATYADGLADVDVAALRRRHAAHRGAVTVTSVPLPSPFGTLTLAAEGRVTAFAEKPRLPDHRINGGFLVLEPRALDHFVAGPDLERDVLPAIAAAGELYVYDHPGFWRSLDTYKDAQELTELARGGPPWMPVSQR